MPQHRGLARAGRTEQREELAVGDVEVDRVDRDDIAEGLAQPAQTDRGLGGGGGGHGRAGPRGISSSGRQQRGAPRCARAGRRAAPLGVRRTLATYPSRDRWWGTGSVAIVTESCEFSSWWTHGRHPGEHPAPDVGASVARALPGREGVRRRSDADGRRPAQPAGGAGLGPRCGWVRRPRAAGRARPCAHRPPAGASMPRRTSPDRAVMTVTTMRSSSTTLWPWLRASTSTGDLPVRPGAAAVDGMRRAPPPAAGVAVRPPTMVRHRGTPTPGTGPIDRTHTAEQAACRQAPARCAASAAWNSAAFSTWGLWPASSTTSVKRPPGADVPVEHGTGLRDHRLRRGDVVPRPAGDDAELAERGEVEHRLVAHDRVLRAADPEHRRLGGEVDDAAHVVVTGRHRVEHAAAPGTEAGPVPPRRRSRPGSCRRRSRW